ncbi:uncharacterized protein LOC121028322 isoform X4 [Herpailurus yagouaroundi]|uniref:uncharacterized protein LOC121028322 isoform X4 n=1 Tax=Herpailurus yagouaroundi TaxID=1608482 RepID=UPI001AD7C9DB|nr:uncharacterized protein LOC121028322 isoform X4 [Puma yagouaroundi]
MAGFQLVVLSEISQDQNETSSLKRKYSRYRKQKYFQSLHEELSQKISVPVFRDTRLCILPETREFSELMDSLPVAGGFRCRRSLTRRNVLSGQDQPVLQNPLCTAQWRWSSEQMPPEDFCAWKTSIILLLHPH